ncbi:unnamed protein product [Amoebophrya sp. A120]|nr:unnamed protein product [Amoebophrya sp. A120]|eukprot:GSA120T00000788001.1
MLRPVWAARLMSLPDSTAARGGRRPGPFRCFAGIGLAHLPLGILPLRRCRCAGSRAPIFHYDPGLPKACFPWTRLTRPDNYVAATQRGGSLLAYPGPCASFCSGVRTSSCDVHGHKRGERSGASTCTRGTFCDTATAANEVQVDAPSAAQLNCILVIERKAIERPGDVKLSKGEGPKRSLNSSLWQGRDGALPDVL